MASSIAKSTEAVQNDFGSRLLTTITTSSTLLFPKLKTARITKRRVKDGR